MKRRRFAQAAIGAAMAGCGRRDTGTLHIALPYAPVVSAFHLAEERGYFTQAGLDLRLQVSERSAMALPLLAGGKLDAAFAFPTPALFNAVGQGARIRIAAACNRLQGGCGEHGCAYGRRASFPGGLTDLRGWKGKRVAINSKASFNDFWMDMALEKAGMAMTDIERVYMDWNEAVVMLLRGTVEVLLNTQGAVPDFGQREGEILREPVASRALPDFQYFFVLFGTRLLGDDLAPGATFLKTYLRGVREFQAGETPKFLVDYARQTKVKLDNFAGPCRGSLSADGVIEPQAVRTIGDWAVRQGYAPRRIALESLIDERALRAAHGIRA